MYIEMLATLLWSEGTSRDMNRGGHVNPFIISLSKSVFQRKICSLIFHMSPGLPEKEKNNSTFEALQ